MGEHYLGLSNVSLACLSEHPTAATVYPSPSSSVTPAMPTQCCRHSTSACHSVRECWPTSTLCLNLRHCSLPCQTSFSKSALPGRSLVFYSHGDSLPKSRRRMVCVHVCVGMGLAVRAGITMESVMVHKTGNTLCSCHLLSATVVFDNMQQQDAHEFLNYLLNTIADLLAGEWSYTWQPLISCFDGCMASSCS